MSFRFREDERAEVKTLSELTPPEIRTNVIGLGIRIPVWVWFGYFGFSGIRFRDPDRGVKRAGRFHLGQPTMDIICCWTVGKQTMSRSVRRLNFYILKIIKVIKLILKFKFNNF